jgi:hypothetical protein
MKNGSLFPAWDWKELLLIVLFVVALGCVRAPASLSWEKVPPFSSTELDKTLRELVHEQTPHVVGSDANKLIRDKIVSKLRAWGYQPTMQREKICNPSCVFVENIVVADGIVGHAPGILMTAHYDAALSSPGAGDDLSGIAVLLETAHALKSAGPGKRPVVFLFADGEEAGLLGAQVFVQKHPWFSQVAWVINLEARGTSGPSLLFETSDKQGALVTDVIQPLSPVFTSSLFQEVYRSMPNDTDFSVYRKHGLHGVNLAFVGNAQNYHTPKDSEDNLDLRSVHHQAWLSWNVVRNLRVAERLPQVAEDKVYFDVLGRFVLAWPAWFSTVMLGLCMLLTVAGTIVAPSKVASSKEKVVRRQTPKIQGFMLVGMVLGQTLLGYLVMKLAQAVGAPRLGGFWEQPWILAIVMLASWWVHKSLGWKISTSIPRLTRWATWAWMLCISSLLCVFLFPMASYLFLLPCLAVQVGWLVFRFSTISEKVKGWVWMALGIVGWILYLPLAMLLLSTLGMAGLLVVIALVGWWSIPWWWVRYPYRAASHEDGATAA